MAIEKLLMEKNEMVSYVRALDLKTTKKAQEQSQVTVDIVEKEIEGIHLPLSTLKEDNPSYGLTSLVNDSVSKATSQEFIESLAAPRIFDHEISSSNLSLPVRPWESDNDQVQQAKLNAAVQICRLENEQHVESIMRDYCKAKELTAITHRKAIDELKERLEIVSKQTEDIIKEKDCELVNARQLLKEKERQYEAQGLEFRNLIGAQQLLVSEKNVFQEKEEKFALVETQLTALRTELDKAQQNIRQLTENLANSTERNLNMNTMLALVEAERNASEQRNQELTGTNDSLEKKIGAILQENAHKQSEIQSSAHMKIAALEEQLLSAQTISRHYTIAFQRLESDIQMEILRSKTKGLEIATLKDVLLKKDEKLRDMRKDMNESAKRAKLSEFEAKNHMEACLELTNQLELRNRDMAVIRHQLCELEGKLENCRREHVSEIRLINDNNDTKMKQMIAEYDLKIIQVINEHCKDKDEALGDFELQVTNAMVEFSRIVESKHELLFKKSQYFECQIMKLEKSIMNVNTRRIEICQSHAKDTAALKSKVIQVKDLNEKLTHSMQLQESRLVENARCMSLENESIIAKNMKLKEIQEHSDVKIKELQFEIDQVRAFITQIDQCHQHKVQKYKKELAGKENIFSKALADLCIEKKSIAFTSLKHVRKIISTLLTIREVGQCLGIPYPSGKGDFDYLVSQITTGNLMQNEFLDLYPQRSYYCQIVSTLEALMNRYQLSCRETSKLTKAVAQAEINHLKAMEAIKEQLFDMQAQIASITQDLIEKRRVIKALKLESQSKSEELALQSKSLADMKVKLFDSENTRCKIELRIASML